MLIVYSPQAVAAFAKRVARRIDHPARQADVEFTRRGLRRTPARAGLVVHAIRDGGRSLLVPSGRLPNVV